MDAQQLPAADSDEFCATVQQILANTAMRGTNEVFDTLDAYGKSKPMIDPLTNYQVVSYRGSMPMMVSCKVKTSAHLRSNYGEDAAGEQLFCPAVTRIVQAQTEAALRITNPAAADKAASFVIEDNEPYASGRGYLGDFQLSFVADDGTIHLNSPGLFQNYDAWYTWILPERLQGQSYCHFATVQYMTALATGAIEPGTPITFDGSIPVTPQ